MNNHLLMLGGYYQIGLADIPILMIVVALGILLFRWMQAQK
jgi:hypothetical protein